MAFEFKELGKAWKQSTLSGISLCLLVFVLSISAGRCIEERSAKEPRVTKQTQEQCPKDDGVDLEPIVWFYFLNQ